MNVIKEKRALSWLILTSALGLHVIDESIHDFLSFYNQSVLSLRDSIGFFPAPTFTFEIWIGGLIGAVIIFYCITPIVMRGGKAIRTIVMAIGIVMIFNALLHIGSSIYLNELTPGVWSSPILFVSSVFVIHQVVKGDWKKNTLTQAPAGGEGPR